RGPRVRPAPVPGRARQRTAERLGLTGYRAGVSEDHGAATTAPSNPTTAPPKRPRRRRVVTVLAWIAIALWGLFALVRVFGWEHGWPLRPAMAYTPYVAAAVALPVLLAILTGSWRNVAAALAVAAVFGTAVLPRAVAGDQPRATGPRLRVLTANLHLGEADLDTLGALVRREEVD